MKYQFTTDWSRAAIGNWSRHLIGYAGTPIVYLEVGVYEGRSGCWMLENILTHPLSRYIGIDAWTTDLRDASRAEVEARCRRNLAHHQSKVELIDGLSEHVLRETRWRPANIDIAYIDGNHTFDACHTDSVLVWPLIVEEGLLMWDDYGSRRRTETVRKAVDDFLSGIPGQFDLLFKNRQIGIRKLTSRP